MRAALMALVIAAPAARAAGFLVLDAEADVAHAREVAQVLRAAGVEAEEGHAVLTPAPRPVTGILESRLAEVRAGYAKFDLATSQRAFAQAMEYLPEAGPWVVDRRTLTELSVLGAAVAHAQGDAAQTKVRLRRALAYDRDLAVTALDFPPDFVALFESVRREVLKAPTTAVEVRSLPSGAQVHLDGRFVGTTPLTLPSDSLTEHFVRVELPGRVAWAGVAAGPIAVVLPKAPLTACPAGALASTAKGPLEASCATALARDAELGVLLVSPSGEVVVLSADGRVFRDRFAARLPTQAEVTNLSAHGSSSKLLPVLAIVGVATAVAAAVGLTAYFLSRPRDTTLEVVFTPVP